MIAEADGDDTGKASSKNLKRIAKHLGERMAREELQGMIGEADGRNTGKASPEVLKRVAKQLGERMTRELRDRRRERRLCPALRGGEEPAGHRGAAGRLVRVGGPRRRGARGRFW